MIPLLDLHLTVDHPGKPGVLRDCALIIHPGEVFALAGQSGCGKSTLALSILRLHDPRRTRMAGKIVFDGRDLLELSEREMRALRGREIAYVPQSPVAALNPAMRVGSQLEEAWDIHSKVRGHERSQSIAKALESVALAGDPGLLRRFPRELSVGMAQRVLIAMAVLHRPRLLIADEATSALDLITQAEILSLFRELNRELGSSVLFITHDLAAAATVATRLAILFGGEVVESGPTAEVMRAPVHPYARKLLAALPRTVSEAEPVEFASDLLRLSQVSAPAKTSAEEGDRVRSR